MKVSLEEKLNNKTAKIGIVGLGYVGLPLMIRYAEESYKVIGFDIDETKIDDFNSGKSYIAHIPDTDIQMCIEAKSETTTNFEEFQK